MDSSTLNRNYYDAFNRKDWNGMLALLAENVAHDANQGGRETGKKAFTAFLEVMNTHYDERLVDIVVMTAPDGRRAAAEFVCKGKYLKAQPGMPAARGQSYSLPVGAFFDITSDGKIGRVTNYYNLADWLRQVK